MRRSSLALPLLAWAGAARAEGMPQLEFGNPLLTAQIVWGAIIFVVFYLLLGRYGLPPVGAILASRANTIGADLERARLAKQDADQAAQELRVAQAQARAESQARIVEATRLAKQEAASRTAALNDRLNRQLAESEAAIAQARNRAMAGLAEVAETISQTVIERLTGQAADAAPVREAVGRVLAERGLAA